MACDINESWLNIGRKYWQEAGVEHKIDFRFGGIVAIDNVLLFGSVAVPNLLDAGFRSRISNADIDAMRKLNEKIRTAPRIDQTMLPLTGGVAPVRKL